MNRENSGVNRTELEIAALRELNRKKTALTVLNRKKAALTKLDRKIATLMALNRNNNAVNGVELEK